MGAITGEAQITNRQIGAIRITRTHTLAEMPEALADRVIKALRRTNLRGKKVDVNAETPGAEGTIRPSLRARERVVYPTVNGMVALAVPHSIRSVAPAGVSVNRDRKDISSRRPCQAALARVPSPGRSGKEPPLALLVLADQQMPPIGAGNGVDGVSCRCQGERTELRGACSS